MPVRAIRKRLRLIQYYSASKPTTRWSRALDVAMLVAMVLPWPLTWMLDRGYVVSIVPDAISGYLYRESDGDVWAWVGPPDLPPDARRGMAAFHGAFTVEMNQVTRGYPFATSSGPRRATLTGEIFEDKRRFTADGLGEADPIRAAVSEGLVYAGHGIAVEAIWTGDVSALVTHSPRAWIANGIVWTVALMIIAWLGVSIARLTSLGVAAGRAVTRRAVDGRCVTCGYDLRAHLFSERCPECGTLL